MPLALLGACALMWVFGYTLDNLSLMALTIAVGFVVDDAIVMLENITRYIEEGEKPLAAAFKGASEIGFTIVSISISLVAVLIPLLLMGGIIGRLFREFAVTLAMTIFVSMVVSLTLTPMMASRFLRAHGETKHGRFYQWSERAFDAMLHAYERGLDRALRWSKTTLLIFFATLGAVGLSVRHHSEGLLPAAGQRPDHGDLRGRAGHLLRRHEAAPGGTRQDRAGRSRRRQRRDGDRRQRQRAGNNGHMFITLKPRDERNATAQQIIARLRPKLEKVEGARLYMQAAQDVRLGGRADADAVRIHAAGRQSRRAERVGAEDPGEDADAAASCATSPPTSRPTGTTLKLKINRDTASRYGIQPQLIDDTLYDAFGQRQVTQYFTQLNSYHVILEILPELQGNLDTLEQDLCQVADHRRSGAAVDLRDLDQRAGRGRCRSATRASSRRSPSASTSPRAWRSARRPTPCRRRWPNWARRPRSVRASRAPRRRSSSRSAPCRC